MPAATPLDAYSAPAELSTPLDRGRVHCFACAHRCVVLPEGRGICRVRFNRAGSLHAPSGYVSSLSPDPVEKKPIYHLLPGSTALTFGMLGCNLHCDFCQNWEISQTLRDERATARFRPIEPEQVVREAARSGARLVVSSYNEPLVTSEWAVRISFRLAREVGLRTAFVSNGYASPEALEYLRPWVDAYKVDLKAMRPETYRRLGARLEPVLDTIRRAVALGIWVEVVTLVVPGMNDSADEPAPDGRLPGRRVARPAVARDRLPPRLPARRRRLDLGRRASDRGGDRRRRRPALHLHGEPRRVGRVGGHTLPEL